MKYYLNFFNEGGCAFVKKPTNLCLEVKNITCPTPPDKKVSFEEGFVKPIKRLTLKILKEDTKY